jgi:hypothetical protein
MDHKAFFKKFTEALDSIVSKPGIPQQAKNALAQLKNDPGLMQTFARPILDAIHQVDPQATVLCQYDIDGMTFCSNFPPEVCTAVGGTQVSSCGNLNDDWSMIDFTAP